MEIIPSLIDGIYQALAPINLALCVIGVIVGLFVGAMPGLGSVNGVAILLPFTFVIQDITGTATCLLYTSPSPRDATLSRMPSSA